jgi:hypothetical protein
MLVLSISKSQKKTDLFQGRFRLLVPKDRRLIPKPFFTAGRSCGKTNQDLACQRFWAVVWADFQSSALNIRSKRISGVPLIKPEKYSI